MTNIIRWALAALLAAGCAGTLEEDPRRPGTGGGGGSGGGGPAVDMCVVGMPTTGPMHTCQAMACHGGPTVSAGLNLENVNLTTNAKAKFLDAPNVGEPMAEAPPCGPGMFKLIDSANPTNSLIYTKAEVLGETPTHPCGAKMPVIGTFTTADKACILSWINSVIALK